MDLDNYECNLIVNNAMIFGALKTTLTRFSKKEGTHSIQMSLDEMNELAGWMAAESNHAESQKKSNELGDLYDYLESLIFQVKRNITSQIKLIVK